MPRYQVVKRKLSGCWKRKDKRMKIETGEEGELILKDVFNSVVFKTDDGEELVACMRDGAFEIATLDLCAKDKDNKKYYTWYYAGSQGIFHQPQQATDTEQKITGQHHE